MVLRIVEVDDKDYLCFGGYVSRKENTIYCRINSTILNKVFNKISNLKIEPAIRDNYILIRKSENGREWYKAVRGLQFSTKGLPLGTIKILINPLEFGLNFSDFGIIREDEKNIILSQKPKLWIKGLVMETMKDKNLYVVFNADERMKNEYVIVIKDENNNVILKRVNPSLETRKLFASGSFRKISGRDNRNELSVAVRSLFPKTENKNIWIGLYPEEWYDKLEITEPFRYVEEKELALELYKNGFVLFSPHSIGIFDIGIGNERGYLESIIEVTNDKPIKQGNSMYGSKGAGITAKIQSIRLWCIKNKKLGFLVLNEKWSKFDWIRNLTKEAKKDGCIFLFTDFKQNWSKNIVNKIANNLNS